MRDDNSDYSDIINLPHPVSERHPRMARGDRAAQFAPYSALVGYESAIKEARRLTEREVALTEDTKTRLDLWCRLLSDIKDSSPMLTLTYFIPDKKKTGGSYKTIKGRLTAFDNYSKTVTIDKKETIPLIYVKEISSPLFAELFDESYS